MTISSIADLLAVGWTHAWCTEGPEFLSAVPSGGFSGIVVGSVGVGGAAATVATWPDEIGTADLTQATASLQPLYVPSDSNLNGKPTVSFDGFDDYMRVTFGSPMAVPVDTVIIGRISSVNGNRTMLDGSSVAKLLSYRSSPTPDDYSINPAACASPNFSAFLNGGTSDTTAHMWRYRMQSFTALFAVDGVTAISGNAANTMCDLEGITLANTRTASAAAAIDVAFVGCYPGVLSAGQLSDILAFSQSHFSTP